MGRFQFALKWFGLIMAASLILSPCLVGLVSAQTAQPSPTAMQPNHSANDVDTPVQIVGSGFSNTDGTPQVWLGQTALSQITWVDDTTLTAQVPWGMQPGVYSLRVVNPDGGEATLDAAFEVTNGVGQWNANAIDGGPVQRVMPIANTPGLVYAYSGVTSAIYRSTNYGATWSTIGHAGGQYFTYDPLNPSYLYLNTLQSTDGGVTWHDMLEANDFLWPGTDRYATPYTQAFPDPAHSGTLFLATASVPADDSAAFGLLRSQDFGQTWQAAETGLPADDRNVTALEFYGSQIYLGTRDGNLYQSSNGGDSWQAMGSAPVLPSIGVLEVNPYEPTELWATTHYAATANARMAIVNLADPLYPVTVLAGWPEDQYPKNLGFLAEDTAFSGTEWDNGWMTTNDGAQWDQFRPSTGKPGYWLALDPWDASQNTFYIADEQYGVQKTTNRGLTWAPVNQGLHAMSPDYLATDPTNPALVYAKIAENGWPGIFVSGDGGQNWDFSSLEPASLDTRPITSTLAVSGDRVFAGAHGNEMLGYGPQIYISEDQGGSWRRVVVDPTPAASDSFHMPWTLKADPQTPETLLLTAIIGNRDLTTDQFFSEIYRSTDHGDTWQPVNLTAQIGHAVSNLAFLAFDPHNPQIVYAAGDHEILKSTNNGVSWSALLSDSTDWFGGPIAVEPVAPYRVYVGGRVSTNGGATWNNANLPMGVSQMLFIPGTDTLYIAGDGLAYSYNGGTNWQFAPGALATARINGLAVGLSDQRTVIYVGTPGGELQPMGQGLAPTSLGTQALNSLEAGVYRLTQVTRQFYLPMIITRRK